MHHGVRSACTFGAAYAFFQKRPSETKKAAANETDLAYRLLQENPDIAKLIIATLQKQGS